MQTAEITPKSNEPKTRQGADNKVSISVSWCEAETQQTKQIH